jgi:hypothetical protein
MTEHGFEDLTVVMDASSRQIIGTVDARDIGQYFTIHEPMMFMEQKAQTEHGLVVMPAFMPILLSELIDTIVVSPVSFYYIRGASKIAIRYRSEWDQYYKAAKASEAGIILTDKMPNDRQ